jgi:hypothetical protein
MVWAVNLAIQNENVLFSVLNFFDKLVNIISELFVFLQIVRRGFITNDWKIIEEYNFLT